MADAIHGAAVLALLAAGVTASQTAPHIVLFLADDMGFNDIGYSDLTMKTPTINTLASGGVKLSNMYTWNWCAPSRAALMTGRYVPNIGYEKAPDGPSNDGDGSGDAYMVPLEFPMIPAALKKQAGYKTVMTGKWHLGYGTMDFVPESRGFDEYLGYLTGAEDYYTHAKAPVSKCPTTLDLWRGGKDGGVTVHRPANETKYFPQYSSLVFTDFAVSQIQKHDPSTPLFMYASYQGIHAPLEVPQEYFNRFSEEPGFKQCDWENDHMKKNKGDGFTCDQKKTPDGKDFAGLNCYCNRLIVKAQMACLDDAVLNITNALKAKGMWQNTVFVLMGDNGGPTFEGHSNTPFRGGKLNWWEGGIRPASFVYSELLPAGSRGTWYNGSLHETDWYNTFVSLAARSTGNPLVNITMDGLDIWPLLSGTESPNTSREVLLADFVLRDGDLKLIAGGFAKETSSTQSLLQDCVLGTEGGWLQPPSGSNNINLCPLDVYTRAGKIGNELCCSKKDGPGVVVTSAIDVAMCAPTFCTKENPCLFNVTVDPEEREDIASKFPGTVTSMLAKLKEYSKGFYTGTGNMMKDNGKFCHVAASRGNFLGPWLD